ncbi:Putative ammonia monooxygenase [Roseivivax sp. THAF40]|uniref:AbrB family transcriptional regulator n=1 Tax=unclassified Roseivivax TaxID=2639302 RepID=UPI0012681BAB|nr:MULTISPECIES: AbrB family transcriptional regulator [unclassified Roseivivax]QFS83116.1 Putative ammonia monooxygenase [Roseivivax sp. THAF197b]QFT46860.1 Putative ammonia monooxygenase [Roseivivax sp. THAF40]
MHRLPPARILYLTALMLLVAAAGGWIAAQIMVPMPWMIGALAASAISVATLQGSLLRDYVFPNRFRNPFIALVGVMIGSQASPELLDSLATLPLALAALLLFILVAHAGNVVIFERLGGYDRATAFYAGTPGGLMESILLGEGAGADIRILTLQQFLRIIFVVTLVPAALSIWAGEPLGSAAGIAPGGDIPPVWSDYVLGAGAAALGLFLARAVHVPAGHLVGPLVITAALTLVGAIDLHLPFWVLAVAQVVIGTSLGLRFLGITAAHIRRGLGLAFVSVAFMLALGAILSLVLAQVTGLDVVQLLLSFAPGGVTEMSLIALSLSVSPALVSLFHVARILMTVGTLMVTPRLVGLGTKS